MNFKQAMELVATKTEEGHEDFCMVGLSHHLKDSNGEFQIVTLTYDYDEVYSDFDALDDLDSEFWLEEQTEDDYDLDNDLDLFVDFDDCPDDDEDAEPDDVECFKVVIKGGGIGSSEGVERHYSAATLEDLIEELPSFVTTLNYRDYNVSPDQMDLGTEQALSLLFPDLSGINDHEDDAGLSKFKAAAINRIDQLNRNY